LARRLLAPIGVALLTIGALGYLFAVDPNEPGHYPACPTQSLLGVDCAGCGLTRATYSLLHGNVPQALDHNILVIAVWAAAIAAWGIWLRRAATGRTPGRSLRASQRQTQFAVVVLMAVLAFSVVRNFVPYLESGLMA
jgi:hypothetical protein